MAQTAQIIAFPRPLTASYMEAVLSIQERDFQLALMPAINKLVRFLDDAQDSEGNIVPVGTEARVVAMAASSIAANGARTHTFICQVQLDDGRRYNVPSDALQVVNPDLYLMSDASLRRRAEALLNSEQALTA